MSYRLVMQRKTAGGNRRLSFERLSERCLLSVNGDFNGDGFDDLAIGVPLENLSGFNNSGAVCVLYGTADGPAVEGTQTWTQNSAGVQGVMEDGDRFGAALAVGDFDGDGYSDLAIAAPGEAIGSVAGAGMVTILYGSEDGLTAAGDQMWHQNSAGIKGASEANENFGMALAAGDFDGDGRDDLAVGILDEHTEATVDSGKVAVIYGSSSGLTAAGDQLWYQASPGIQGSAEANDRFGSALATGDFNGDERDDLAVGVPGEDVDVIADAGAVHVIYGSGSGLTNVGDHCWNEDEIGVDPAEAGDLFGTALAAGDFNGDGDDDLAVGAPQDDSGEGAVTVLYGSPVNLVLDDTERFTAGGLGFLGVAGAQFGASLAAGDFNGDGETDLAVGAPFDTNLLGEAIGKAYVIYGTNPNGLTASGAVQFNQGTLGVEGTAADQDRFGATLATGDYDGDGRADLAIGVPDDDDSGVTDSGSVNVLYGLVSGLDATDDQIWDQDNMNSSADVGDDFGLALG